MIAAIPGAQTLLLLFDPDRFNPDLLASVTALPPAAPRTIRLPTLYDGADLDGFAIPRDQVVRLHAEAIWTVAFLGFAPGFAYLTGAPPALVVPRLATPRVRVPAGSVAVAGGYGGIYPDESPGGWRLLGRVSRRMFDPAALPPALLQPGDRVIFEPVAALSPEPPKVVRPPDGEPVLRVLSPGAFTSVQGAPRPGPGAACGGAMDLPALAFVNRQVGNPAGAAGLEITLVGPQLEALAPVTLSTGQLREGERIKLGAVQEGVRGYLGVAGGLLQPELPRALQRGEVLYRGSPALVPEQPFAAHGLTAATLAASGAPARAAFPGIIRAMPGPQLEFFTTEAVEMFFSIDYRVSPNSDRRGLRLLGPALAFARAADLPPEGTAPGAVQVPGDGLPIVLGPDRPVTGGYPKIATVISADLPFLAQLRPGATLRFRRVSLAEALAARKSSYP